MKIRIAVGFAPEERARIARMYWQASGPKLGKVMGPEPRALAFFERVLDPEFAISARAPDGALLGVAGFKTSEGALTGGKVADLRAIYGMLSLAWRLPLLAMLERDLEPGILLMDGIFVTPEARGHGVGTALLAAIKDKARALGCTHVRLDVIDTNPRARALYERQGFVGEGTEHLGLLRVVFGFSSALRMTCPV